MLKLGILPLLRRSHRVIRGLLGALWIGLLVFQSLNGSETSCWNEMQLTAAISGAVPGVMAMDTEMHSATSLRDGSLIRANEPVPADAASMPGPTQSPPCDHAAMAGACQGCTIVVPIIVADVSTSTPNADVVFPSIHTARSQLIIAPDARPPKA